jgi:phosphoribosylamine--glycine ligase
VNVLLVGGGGREHALAWRILRSPLVESLYVTHDNPGFPVTVVKLSGDLVEQAQSAGIDLVIIGPEAPLAAGLSDRLRAQGIDVFGPSMAAAQLESSKAFAKSFMDRHAIPTAGWSSHTDSDSAHAAIDGPCVVKADGLAAGKGVFVTSNAQEAHDAVDAVFAGAFGDAGHRVVIEELLVGPELSLLALCDGVRAVPLMPCRDHKRRHDEDMGPNTGGMGAICPPPGTGDGLTAEICRTVLQPVVDGMAAEGHPFSGVLYAGLMLTDDGPKVLEFNVRFGDPECQPLMLMLGEDIVPWLRSAARGQLIERELVWRDGAACCVVMCAGAYPQSVPKGMSITGLPVPTDDLVVFFAGAERQGTEVVSSGGRVLGVTAHGSTLQKARERAYQAVAEIHFDTADWRTDIGGDKQ